MEDIQENIHADVGTEGVNSCYRHWVVLQQRAGPLTQLVTITFQ